MTKPNATKPHVPAIRPEWLALTREEPVDPSQPIIDAHIHLWDFSEPPYFAREHLDDAQSGHAVEASVFVECMMAYDDGPPAFRPVGETRFVAAQAEAAEEGKTRVAAAILGAADLSTGSAVRPVLESHVEAGKGRFRGLRVRAAWDADPVAGYGAAGAPRHLLRRPGFLEGAHCLASLGLSMDVWVFHTQLEEVAAFAAAAPEVKIALNHVGGPLGVGAYADRRDDVFDAWAKGLRELARRPNVHVKIGGLGISRMGFNFDAAARPLSSDELAAAWAPYVTTCIEAFGAERAMFGSNFPVDKSACSYVVLLNAFKKIAGGASADEKRLIFADNARSFYRI